MYKELFEEGIKGTKKIRFSGLLRIVLVALLVLLQLLTMFFFTYWLRGNYVFIYLTVELISMLLGVFLVNVYRNSSYKIAWLCIFLIFPLTGHIMFLLWGNRYSKKIMERKITKTIVQSSSIYLKQDENIRNEFKIKKPNQNKISVYLENHQFPLFKNNIIDYYPLEKMFQGY